MKARIETEGVRLYNNLPQDFQNILNFPKSSIEIQNQYGFYDVIYPSYNTETERLGEIYFDQVTKVFTYMVHQKSGQELESEKTQRLINEANTADDQINNSLLKVFLRESLKSEPIEKLLEYKTIFPAWRPNTTLVALDKIYFREKLYEVIQGHTTQLDWTPDITPSLFKEIAPPGTIPNWKQPTGAHDSYNIGDKVKHNNITWTSSVNGNVWEPGVYGWTQT